MSRKIRLKRKATNFPGKHPRKKQCAPNTNLNPQPVQCIASANDLSLSSFRSVFGF